jgi:hypothetical protein
LVAFGVLVTLATAAALWVYRHATVPESATLHVVSGSGALVRSPTDPDWRLVTGETPIHEGDRVSTALGTVVTLTMFDGSTVEVTEDTIVEIERMRVSRFLKRTKLIVVDAERGAVYVAMASRGEFGYSETTVRAGDVRVSMTDEPGRQEAGAFLVEIQARPDQEPEGVHTVRAAVLRGAAIVGTDVDSGKLHANEQTVVGVDRALGPTTDAVRELIVNGTFSAGLGGWVEYEQQTQRSAGRQPIDASLELVPDRATRGNVVAVEFLRVGASDDAVQFGLRQPIGKTLRVHSSLVLEFEVLIRSQQPSGGGPDQSQFPLIVKLNYIDPQGQEREWWHGYYVQEDPERPVPRQRATKIDRDQWQRVVFDLRNISPLPRQITSIVMYASGQSYQTRIANVSLTSSELVDSDS